MERHRIAADGSIYYVTFSVVQWLPVFVSEASCRIVTDSLRFCRERKGLCSNAYVIMPTHLHACFSDVFRQSAGADKSRQFRQATRHPEVLETEKFWRQKRDYIHENPCRKGLVRRPQDWRFSSAAFWLSDGHAESDVLLTAIDWA
jgi:REP element-mobilizing transposase RayT